MLEMGVEFGSAAVNVNCFNRLFFNKPDHTINRIPRHDFMPIRASVNMTVHAGLVT